MQQQQEHLTKQSRKYRLLGPCATIFDSSNTGSWRLEYPKVDDASCIRCGVCVRSCPANVIDLDKQRTPAISIDWNYCKGCGVCANQCVKKCIEMVSGRGPANG